MIGTEELRQIVGEYTRNNKTPSKPGLADALSISCTTVYNVLNGTYNGKNYGLKPSWGRCVRNEDFEILRNVFR